MSRLWSGRGYWGGDRSPENVRLARELQALRGSRPVVFDHSLDDWLTYDADEAYGHGLGPRRARNG